MVLDHGHLDVGYCRSVLSRHFISVAVSNDNIGRGVAIGRRA